MTELWISYKDEEGRERRVRVDKHEFIIGRHSAADLCIPSDRLSREHVRIERFGDVFVAADCGSTNGTKVSGRVLSSPSSLRHGDVLDLGGILLSVELEASSYLPAAFQDFESPEVASIEREAVIEPVAAAEPAVVQPAQRSPIPMGVFILGPVLGLVLLVVAGTLIYSFGTGGEASEPGEEEFVYAEKQTNDSPRTSKNSNRESPVEADGTPPQNSARPTETNAAATPAVDLNETQKSEQNAAAFLRQIAQNDPKAFLTSEQAGLVNAKIKQLAGSAVADNISSARKNASQIRALAATKNLKPQFLAAAGIAKLGGSRGDVFQAAQSMADVFDKLGTQIGNELADDSLLMVAAYNQGTAGDFMKMRNMLQDLATKFPESSRSIRTIWFLRKNGKITEAEFDFALKFLAVGTIMQNPKDFNVNSEALML